VLRFLGFELDEQRAELRGPDGSPIRIRLKSLEMLKLFAANPGRVLSKQELMEAIWPGLHIGEDSLFQSIRELRAALGDEQRQIIKLMSGRGYLFAAVVSGAAEAPQSGANGMEGKQNPARRGFSMTRRAAFAVIAGLGLSALAIAQWPPRFFSGQPVSVAVLPVATESDDPLATRMATSVTSDLIDGLAKIEAIRVMLPSDKASKADYVISGELGRTETAWTLRARMSEPATGTIKWATSLSIVRSDADPQLQQTRLTAGIGHPLAQRINTLVKAGERAGERLPTGAAKIAIEQATASINHTTPERFGAALAMLEKALADEPLDIDLQVALAAFQLRGMQMTWFPAAEREAAENNIGAVMARALKARPDYIPALETQCRFLATTNHFVESLVTCGKVLSHDPWNGVALYLMGLSQVFLGRFDDALASFERATHFDTPQVARWTWALGIGWTYLLTERAEEAIPWLQRSIAITPGTGRTHMALAAAYQQLSRNEDAKAAMTAALALRPGSTARNILPPAKNNSAVYLKAYERVLSLMVAAGLPK